MQPRPYLYNILSLFLIAEHADTACREMKIMGDKNETHCICSPLKKKYVTNEAIVSIVNL